MPDWRHELRELSRDLGSHARRVARAVDSAIDRDPFHVVGYRGYASHWRALVLGRVLQDEGIVPPDASHSNWQNLLNTVRRLESDPLPLARVRATIAGESHRSSSATTKGFLREGGVKLEEGRWPRDNGIR